MWWADLNNRHENDGPSKLQGMKMQDMKLQDMKLQDMTNEISFLFLPISVIVAVLWKI